MSTKTFNPDVFRSRVLALMESKSITAKQIVTDREGQISFAWFSKLKNNSIKSPSADIVFMLADYFGVSTDYLLGLSDIKSSDADVKAICSRLCISDQSFDKLEEVGHYYKDCECEHVLNYVLSNLDEFTAPLVYIDDSIKDLYYTIISRCPACDESKKLFEGDCILSQQAVMRFIADAFRPYNSSKNNGKDINDRITLDDSFLEQILLDQQMIELSVFKAHREFLKEIELFCNVSAKALVKTECAEPKGSDKE